MLLLTSLKEHEENSEESRADGKVRLVTQRSVALANDREVGTLCRPERCRRQADERCGRYHGPPDGIPVGRHEDDVSTE